jgi:plasmid stabilization system protein ParE
VAHKVVLTPKGLDDIRRNTAWMARHFSPRSAARWTVGVESAIASLSDHPERCPEADEADDLGIDLRMLVYRRGRQVFRILFTIDGRTVTVRRVLHAAQDRLTPDDI